MNRKFIPGTVLLSLLALVGTAQAQDPLLAELYGQGVHAYFQGQNDQAHDLLSASINEGSRDPRCYYFRGLVYEKLGRPDEAEADFKKGAELEANLGTQFYAVGRSLERVQGDVRLKLETFRQVARLDARRKELDTRAERYEQFQRNEANVLRGATTPPDTLPAIPDNGQEDPTAPFGGTTPRAVTPTPPMPPTPEPPPADDDPFGTAPATPPRPTPPAADDDPFGDAPATPPRPMPPATDDDPFGDAPATPPAPAPAADDDPLGDAPATPAAPAADDDPFGATDEKPATPPPAADDKPATPPAPAPAADDDPFGAAEETPEAPPEPVEDDNPFD